MRATISTFVISCSVISLVVAACGSTPPPKNEDSTGELPLVVPTGKGVAIETPPEETAKPEAPPAETASAAASAPPPPSGPQDSRPPVLKSDDEEVQDTIGVSPGAKMEVGDDTGRATLRIYENSFTTGVNVTFKIDKKAKAGGQVLGKIYHVTVVIPPSPTPEKISSNGHPFEVKLPAGNQKNANLAIGEISGGKVTWRVIAPEKIDDATGIAQYHLPDLFDYYLHVTTRPVTAPKN